MLEKTVNNTTIKLSVEDITLSEVECFVFYASEDLKLGSGFGTAISVRGGPTIQKELKGLGPIEVTQAVLSGAGELQASHIIHACGPKFNEPETEKKLKETLRAVLDLAGERGIQTLAFPAMGAGFYGIPLDECAKWSLEEVRDYARNGCQQTVIRFCMVDAREYAAFEKQMTAMSW